MDLQTQANLHQLRAQLRMLRHELRGELAAAPRRTTRDRTDTADRKDLARELDASRIDEIREMRELTELDAVEAAIRRMDADAYGDCCECGEPIGLARLQQLPMATRCADCQHRLEEDLQLGRPRPPGARPVHYA